MRIQEVIAEDVNPDIRNPEFEHEQQIGDFLYTARTQVSPSGLTTYLLVRCRSGNDLIGKADFEMRVNAGRKWLESLNTQVLPEYQSQGIASTMYAYAKMLGNDIKPSRDQSDQGKAMWKGWQKSGAAKHLLPEDQNVPSVLYHATYRPLLRSIKKNGLGGPGSEHKRWEDSIHGIVYLATDPNVAESYAETSETVPDEWLDEIVILKINTRALDPNKLRLDQNVSDNTGDTLEYHGIIPITAISA